MNRKNKFSDFQKRMIKDEGSQLDDYIAVRIYTIKSNGKKIEDEYMVFSRDRCLISSLKSFFFKNKPIEFPNGDSYFFDDPELKIIENGEYFSLIQKEKKYV